MAQKFSDAARTTLASGIAAGDTSLTLNSGASFPVANTGSSTISEGADWFKVVLQDASKFEIVYARTHALNALVISDVLRGQEGTTAATFAASSVVGLRQTAMDAALYAATKVALESHVGSGGAAHADATGSVDGFMSAADKTKLDGVATGATNYAHPANHPASIITQDASNRFVTDTEKTAWNAKQVAGNYATGGGTATGTNTGDQVLPTLASLGAQAAGTYASGTGSASGVNTGDETTATIKTKLGVSTLSGSNTGDQTTITGNAGSATTLSAGADRTKLDSIAASANNYTHPANHPASIITQDASNRFVTDTEKATWNAKQPAGTYATGGGTATGTNTGDQDLSGKQDVLVSGVDIKTLDGNSLLGGGNIEFPKVASPIVFSLIFGG